MNAVKIQRGTKLLDNLGTIVGMITGFDCTVQLQNKTLQYWHVDVDDNEDCYSMELQYILNKYILA
ncbi:hypothetical protein APK37_01 [Acinetobacter phage vB_AbaP_APK37]|uniref:Uncharacterized protein n=1 Tax=Acinetobacter phage vB_AbaP_APK37 TaxID=2500564 RepID=A0A5H2UHB3_9CAUD|nr:hypothetical protein APK37_01 [Acinetobacter phage vB_AbaP_APK37]